MWPPEVSAHFLRSVTDNEVRCYLCKRPGLAERMEIGLAAKLFLNSLSSPAQLLPAAAVLKPQQCCPKHLGLVSHLLLVSQLCH